MTSGAPLTFVFTDLVGSTRLLDSAGADAFDVLRRDHYTALRDALAAHGGKEVKNLGDGLMAVFANPVEALGSAVSMQRAVLRQGARSEFGPLGLRIGLAVGPATYEEGDYWGVAVVTAKRLCDRADGGQILATELMRALVAGSPHRFREVGMLELKGLSEPVAACELLWEAENGEPIPLPPALAAPASIEFVGRESELARLRQATSAARDAAPPVVAVTGEPGIGKTHLIGRLAAGAHADGATVLFGRCFEEALVPYQPFVEALRHYCSTCPLDELRSQLGRHGAELARLVPDLADRVPGLSAQAVEEPDGERYRLFEAVRHLLGAAAAERPLLLLVDDVHWADPATLSLLAHVTRAPEPLGLLVVLTYREAEATGSGPLADTLAELHRERVVERVRLTGLGRDELSALVRREAGGEIATGLVRAVHDETDGNPFFARELVRHLVESSDGAALDDQVGVLDRGIPDTVREVLGRRVATLGPESERVLAVAAVLGREFRPSRLEGHAELAGSDVAGALEDALTAGLVEEAPGRPGSFRFAHALTRETVYQGLPSPRRARLHRQAGEALETLVERVGTEGRHLTELAHHFFEATALGGDDKAIDYAVRAGEWATRQVAYEEAAIQYRRAVGALERSEYPSEHRRCELLLVLGNALWRAGDIDAAREQFRLAVDLAEALGDAERLGRAALGLVGPFNTAGAPDPHAVAKVERALELLPEDPSPLRARLLGRLCDLLGAVAPREQVVALGREAVAMARAIGDRGALADVLHAIHVATWNPDDLDGRLVAAAEMAQLESEPGEGGLAGYGYTWRLACELERVDRGAADTILAAQEAEAERLRRPWEVWQVAVHRGMEALLEGRLDEVEALATHALGLAPDVNNAIQIYGVQLMFLRREQARLGEMVDLIKTYADQNPEFVAWRCAYGWICSEAGRPGEAAAVLEEILSDDLAGLPRDFLYLAALMGLCDSAAELGDVRAAERLRHRLAPYAGQAVLVAPVAVCHGAAARPLGRVHALVGDFEAAERAFETALDVNARLRAAPALGHTQLEYARALLARGGAGDAERAGRLVEAAAATAAGLRLPALAARCDGLAVRRSTAGSSPSA